MIGTVRRTDAVLHAIPATTSSAYIIPGLKTKFLEVRHANPMEQCLLIIERICAYFDITPDQLKSKTRKEEVVLPRHIAMYLQATTTSLSLKQIGKLYNRDHTTVIHARDTVRDEIGTGSDRDCCLREIKDGVEKRVRTELPKSPNELKKATQNGSYMPIEQVNRIMSMLSRGHTKTQVEQVLRVTAYTVDHAIWLAKNRPDAYSY